MAFFVIAATMFPKLATPANAEICPPADYKITVGPCVNGEELVTVTCDGELVSQEEVACS
jgi:hypothetical protein